MKVFNLLDDRELQYLDCVTPIEAVTQAYCEEKSLLSAWNYARHSRSKGEFYKFTDTLPVVFGACSVLCGNWAAFIKGEK